MKRAWWPRLGKRERRLKRDDQRKRKGINDVKGATEAEPVNLGRSVDKSWQKVEMRKEAQLLVLPIRWVTARCGEDRHRREDPVGCTLGGTVPGVDHRGLSASPNTLQPFAHGSLIRWAKTQSYPWFHRLKTGLPTYQQSSLWDCFWSKARKWNLVGIRGERSLPTQFQDIRLRSKEFLKRCPIFYWNIYLMLPDSH